MSKDGNNLGDVDKKRQKLLSELIELRNTDIDSFMERMYEALNTVFQDSVTNKNSREDKLKAIETMVKYLDKYEEYEKCSRLLEIKKMINEYHDSSESSAKS